MVCQKLKIRSECLGKRNDTKASLSCNLLWCGFLWNTVPAWINLKGFSLPSLFQNSTCNIEAAVWGVRGRKPSAPTAVLRRFQENLTCVEMSQTIRVVKSQLYEKLEYVMAQSVHQLYHNIHNGELYYMVAEIGIFMCCLYFTSN